MRLLLLLPSGIMVDRSGVTKVIAEAPHGVFALLPRHVDFVAPIVPGIVLFEEEAIETLIGVDEGILVKRGDQVRISVRDAVRGEDWETIREVVVRRFRQLDEREERARTALARLEASFYRRFVEQEAWHAG